MKWMSLTCVLLGCIAAADALLAEGPGLMLRAQRLQRPLVVDDERKESVKKEEEAQHLEPPAPAWTSTGPDSTDYNKETHVEHLPVSVETFFATIYCILIASAPLLLATLAEEQLTRTHMCESVALIVWLGGALFFFTNVLKFQSLHWEGTRPLTIVEAVYLLSQILTTVGYGDITPAFPRGQVLVGINVIIALCLYGSLITEVMGIVNNRVKKAIARSKAVDPDHATPLKKWTRGREVDKSGIIRSAIFFGSTATIGVLFWHFYPGEGKTWLQAVYMSVITLSTVGFGAFNATTEGGKVFGAFWMLVGVASLGALVGSFIEFMLQQKQSEMRSVEDDMVEFKRILDACVDKTGKLDKIRFLKYGLMLTKDVKQNQFDKIEARFQKLATIVGEQPLVRRNTVVEQEGPPL